MTDRKKMILRELQAYDDSNSKATYPIDFRGEKKYLPVIKVNSELLLLNHKNNRLSGQLFDHPDRMQIETNPELCESQKLIMGLLVKTDKFKELKEQLETLGQKEPGLITREGLIVNGNTRVAAMRMLNMQFVDVAVLPENVIDSDVLDIEMALQVTDLVHQDYTFTNELLLMKRFLNNGGSEKELAKKMAWVRRGESKVRMHMRLLDYIEEIRCLSEYPVPYSVFDSKKQHLKDLDDDYMRLKDEGDIDAAENLKWTRLSMIFLGLNKDQVRAIDEDFIDQHLLNRLTDEENIEVFEHLETYRPNVVNDGLDDLLGEQADSNPINMKNFLKDILDDKAKRDEEGDVSIDLDGIVERISWNARRASEKIIDDQKLEGAKAEPSEVLRDMRIKLQDLRAKLPELKDTNGFKKGRFEYDLKKVLEEINKISTLMKS